MPLPYYTPHDPNPKRPRQWENGHALIIETATGRDLSVTCQCGTGIGYITDGRSATIPSTTLKTWADHVTYGTTTE